MRLGELNRLVPPPDWPYWIDILWVTWQKLHRISAIWLFFCHFFWHFGSLTLEKLVSERSDPLIGSHVLVQGQKRPILADFFDEVVNFYDLERLLMSWPYWFCICFELGDTKLARPWIFSGWTTTTKNTISKLSYLALIYLPWHNKKNEELSYDQKSKRNKN